MKKLTVLLGALVLAAAASLLLIRSRVVSPAAVPPPAPATTTATAVPPAAAARTTTNVVAAKSREFDLAVNPYAGGLKEPGKSKRAFAADFLAQYQQAAGGDPIRFELTDGQMAVGVIRITKNNAAGELAYLSGELTEPEAGQFFFLKQAPARLPGACFK